MHFTGRAGCVSCSDLCHFLLISAGDPYPFCTFRPTLPCLYIPVRPLSEGRTTSLFYRLFQKLQQLRQGFRMGQIPPKVCRQKPDRHDHKGSDKYRGKSADTAVQPNAADTAYQRGTGINMLYENIRFLSRHHVTHQTAAHAGEHADKYQQKVLSG